MRQLAVILSLIVSLIGGTASYAQSPSVSTFRPHLAAALSEHKIEVDVDFSGTRITLFAVSDEWDNPDVAFAVALVGPHRPYAVTRHTKDAKERFEFVSAPAVLAVAAEQSLKEIGSPEALALAGINPRYSAKPLPDYASDPKLEYWRQAFAELKAKDGLFSSHDEGLERLDGGLIRADIDLPAAAPPGDYDVRIFLFKEGVLLAEAQTPLALKREGVEYTLYGLSKKQPILYGLLAVFLGCFVGIGAAMFGSRR